MLLFVIGERDWVARVVGKVHPCRKMATPRWRKAVVWTIGLVVVLLIVAYVLAVAGVFGPLGD